MGVGCEHREVSVGRWAEGRERRKVNLENWGAAPCGSATLESTFDLRVYLRFKGLPSIQRSGFDSRVYLRFKGSPSIQGSTFHSRVYL